MLANVPRPLGSRTQHAVPTTHIKVTLVYDPFYILKQGTEDTLSPTYVGDALAPGLGPTSDSR